MFPVVDLIVFNINDKITRHCISFRNTMRNGVHTNKRTERKNMNCNERFLDISLEMKNYDLLNEIFNQCSCIDYGISDRRYHLNKK